MVLPSAIVDAYFLLSDSDRSCVAAMLEDESRVQLTSLSSAHHLFYEELQIRGWAFPANVPPELAAADLRSWALTDLGREQLYRLLFELSVAQRQSQLGQHRSTTIALFAAKFFVSYAFWSFSYAVVSLWLKHKLQLTFPLQAVISLVGIFIVLAVSMYTAASYWGFYLSDSAAIKRIAYLQFLKTKERPLAILLAICAKLWILSFWALKLSVGAADTPDDLGLFVINRLSYLAVSGLFCFFTLPFVLENRLKAMRAT